MKTNIAWLWYKSLINVTFQKKSKQAGPLPLTCTISSIHCYGFGYICWWNVASLVYSWHHQFVQGTETLSPPSSFTLITSLTLPIVIMTKPLVKRKQRNLLFIFFKKEVFYNVSQPLLRKILNLNMGKMVLKSQ